MDKNNRKMKILHKCIKATTDIGGPEAINQKSTLPSKYMQNINKLNIIYVTRSHERYTKSLTASRATRFVTREGYF